MYVSHYATYIQPTKRDTTRAFETQSSSKATKSFLLEAQQRNGSSQKQAPNEVVYLYPKATQNYHANRYKLSSQQDPQLRRFQELSRRTVLPQAYDTKITTLYDLVKPKKALMAPPPDTADKSTFGLLKQEQAKLRMLQTYKADTSYYESRAA